MRIDWVPYSAASLVLGATALSVGALLAPQLGEGNVLLSDFADTRWVAVAVLYFIASAALTVGMPSVMTLFERRGGRLGLCAIGIFTIGTLGIAGYAFLIAFMRALAQESKLGSLDLEFASHDTGLLAILYGWILAFYLGELLLGIALLRAKTTPKWAPGALLLHVALFPLSLLLPSLLPQEIQSLTALLITVGLCGVGITANQEAAKIAVPA
jgi:hypothetical protein